MSDIHWRMGWCMYYSHGKIWYNAAKNVGTCVKTRQ